ncbi:MAG: hypothetical protein WDZ41_05510 [Candidatus Babeliales bacterium]
MQFSLEDRFPKGTASQSFFTRYDENAKQELKKIIEKNIFYINNEFSPGRKTLNTENIKSIAETFPKEQKANLVLAKFLIFLPDPESISGNSILKARQKAIKKFADTCDLQETIDFTTVFATKLTNEVNHSENRSHFRKFFKEKAAQLKSRGDRIKKFLKGIVLSLAFQYSKNYVMSWFKK